MAYDGRWKELGEFLRSRRAKLHPSDFNLPQTHTTRRVPGLRREEVASLAGISTEYYTRLEQGRLPASAAVLEDLSYVMRLSADQHNYIFHLARKESHRVTRSQECISPALQRMLDDLSTTPAFVIGRHTNIIGWNALAAALITDFGAIPAQQRYFIRLLFTNPAMRKLYVDWRDVVDLAIAHLRMDSARAPDDPQLLALISELSAKDSEFDALWHSHEVASKSGGSKRLNHPLLGMLTLKWEALSPIANPEQQIIIWTAEAGSPSYLALQRLSRMTGGAHSSSD